MFDWFKKRKTTPPTPSTDAVKWPDDPGFRDANRVARAELKRQRAIRIWQERYDMLLAEARELGISPHVVVDRNGQTTKDSSRWGRPYVDRES